MINLSCHSLPGVLTPVNGDQLLLNLLATCVALAEVTACDVTHIYSCMSLT